MLREQGLRCPIDGEPLESSGDELTCGSHHYPVIGGMPRFGVGDQDATASTFGGKWEATPPEERRWLSAFQFEWYDERFGWGDEAGLAAHLAGCSRILDAGCGLGYDADRYARLAPHAEVVGFDLSSSVELAQRDFGDRPNLAFLQADIMAPPFAPATFDFVIADQVIHHTPDCAGAFARLAELVAPGGQLAVYVYRRKGLLRELADDHVRERTTAMSFDECMEFSRQVTELGRELSRVGATIRLEQGIPLLGIPPGEHDVQRLVYWHFLKCWWNEEAGERQSVLTNFDWYHPVYASRHTEEEVRGWCAEAGLEVLHLDVGDSGISVRAGR
jgi:SAM-dependent methyltransferase